MIIKKTRWRKAWIESAEQCFGRHVTKNRTFQSIQFNFSIKSNQSSVSLVKVWFQSTDFWVKSKTYRGSLLNSQNVSQLKMSSDQKKPNLWLGSAPLSWLWFSDFMTWLTWWLLFVDLENGFFHSVLPVHHHHYLSTCLLACILYIVFHISPLETQHTVHDIECKIFGLQ